MNDNEYVLYYIFLKPNLLGNGDLTKKHKGITLSRTYRGICFRDSFEKVISGVAGETENLRGKFFGVSKFGDDKNILALDVKCNGLEELHRKVMTRLLFSGSPYFGDYLYEGYGRTTRTENGFSILENRYNPHISFSKFLDSVEPREFIGKDFSLDGIYLSIKRFGKWDDKIEFYSFAS